MLRETRDVPEDGIDYKENRTRYFEQKLQEPWTLSWGEGLNTERNFRHQERKELK
jgi:hypothetical protein